MPSSSVWGGNVAGGGTRYTVTVPPRTGVLGSAAWEVPLHAGDGRAARRELGPKPELWDAHLSVQGLGSTSESKPEWRNMKVRYHPFVAFTYLALHILSPSQPSLWKTMPMAM